MAILHLLVGASVAASPIPQAPHVAPVATRLAVPDHPALWVVNDGDTIIYLFGTFHALDGKSRWFEQAVKTAFSASDQLMLETLVPDSLRGPTPVAQPIAGFSHQPGPLAKLAPSASSMLTSSRTVMRAGRTEGMSTDRGADAVLRDAADQTGKPVAGFESFQFQLSMFNSLQTTPQAPAAQNPRAIRALGSVLSNLEAAWNRGDVETAFTPLLQQMEKESPQTYKTMFVERNARWAHWIAQRLKSPGTVFVAVGAGHLSGPDSVQNQLAAIGVKSARIN